MISAAPSLIHAAMAVTLLIAMALVAARLFLGATLYDRVLAANSFGTKSALLLAALGFAAGRPDFLDISLLYALLTFMGTIAILRFFRASDMRDADEPADPKEKRDSP